MDIGAYSGNSDGGILSDSEIGKYLRNNTLNLPEGRTTLLGCDIHIPGFFVADNAFQLSTRIMKPYSGKYLSNKNKFLIIEFQELDKQ